MKIHFVIYKNQHFRYLCNQPHKNDKDGEDLTADYYKITCKNCKRIFDRNLRRKLNGLDSYFDDKKS